MQPGSGEDPFFEAVPLENPLHGRRIRMSPEVTESRDQPPRALRPHHQFEILPVMCEGMHVMQNQAAPMQMQMPFVEGDQFLQAQIGCFHECPVKGWSGVTDFRSVDVRLATPLRSLLVKR